MVGTRCHPAHAIPRGGWARQHAAASPSPAPRRWQALDPPAQTAAAPFCVHGRVFPTFTHLFGGRGSTPHKGGTCAPKQRGRDQATSGGEISTTHTRNGLADQARRCRRVCLGQTIAAIWRAPGSQGKACRRPAVGACHATASTHTSTHHLSGGHRPQKQTEPSGCWHSLPCPLQLSQWRRTRRGRPGLAGHRGGNRGMKCGWEAGPQVFRQGAAAIRPPSITSHASDIVARPLPTWLLHARARWQAAACGSIADCPSCVTSVGALTACVHAVMRH